MNNYITHEVILEELEKKFPNKNWDEEDVLRWCQQVETIYVADPDTMWMYKEIVLPVNVGKVKLPPNIFRLLDVYDPDTDLRVRFNKRGMILKQLIDYQKDTIAINYIGTPIDKDNDYLPLIYETHYPACETFCKIQGFEYDALYGELNQNLYFDWKNRFDVMIQSVKGDYKHWTTDDFNAMVTIMGDEIPKIGFMQLIHKREIL